jgi:hypothetical protein
MEKGLSTKDLKVGSVLLGAQGPVVVSEIIDDRRVRIEGVKSTFTYGVCLLPFIKKLDGDMLDDLGFVLSKVYDGIDKWSKGGFFLYSFYDSEEGRYVYHLPSSDIGIIFIETLEQLNLIHKAFFGEGLIGNGDNAKA